VLTEGGAREAGPIRRIYFVGRDQGLRFWKTRLGLEKHRRGELAGLRSQPRTRRTRIPTRADVISVRNKPENTTDAELEELTRFVERYEDGTRLVINPPKSFLLCDSKDRAFSAWSAHGLVCPRHWVLETDPDDPEDFACAEQVRALLETESRILLRTNNEAGGQGLYVVDREMSPKGLLEVIRVLKERTARLRRIRRDTRIIAVEYVDAHDSDGYTALHRAFVLFDRVVGYFAVVSDRFNIHPWDMTFEVFDRWLEANRELRGLIEASGAASDIVRAVQVLGNNIGAVDFLVREGVPTVLEVNPLWGTVPQARFAFGDEAFEAHLEATEDSWSKELPHIAENLDPDGFYHRMYGTIAERADQLVSP